MPKSWSKKKKAEYLDEYHRQVPDVDNLFKALADAIYEDDSAICDVRIRKIWAEVGAVVIEY